MAQMLADLNDLQAAQDQSASKSLVSANKTLDRKPQPRTETQPQPKAAADVAPAASTGGTQATNKFGLRMFSPPLTRKNSATPSSIPGTPTREDGPDTDIDRASTLLSLYEIRAKLKEQDNSSLIKAREKINALAAKQQMVAEQKKPAAPSPRKGTTTGPSRFNYPK